MALDRMGRGWTGAALALALGLAGCGAAEDMTGDGAASAEGGNAGGSEAGGSEAGGTEPAGADAAGAPTTPGGDTGTAPAPPGMPAAGSSEPPVSATTPSECVSDAPLYLDEDGDGYGAGDSTMTGDSCMVPAGYAAQAGDCAPSDPFAGVSDGICGDYVDNNCDQADDSDACPETQAAGLTVPDWDCQGDAPENVYAFASYPSGNGFFRDGACLYFFEGAKDLFYAKWSGLAPAEERVSDSCSTYDGCICPDDAPTFLPASYDRRLYAFTWDGDEQCDNIVLVDHGNMLEAGTNNEQPVSNSCRKYLYALHGEGDHLVSAGAFDGQPAFDLPYSYVAGDLGDLQRRLSAFPKMEVACAEVSMANIPWAQLMVADVQYNEGFQRQ